MDVKFPKENFQRCPVCGAVDSYDYNVHGNYFSCQQCKTSLYITENGLDYSNAIKKLEMKLKFAKVEQNLIEERIVFLRGLSAK
jgi:transcription initiation factor IIE alpha subunit